MFLKVERVLKEDYIILFIDMKKIITKTWKIMIKIKESPSILGCKYFIGLGNVTKATIEDTFQFNEDFIKTIMKKVK